MHDLDLILTMTSGLAAALLLGYLTHRIGLSPIVGYLLAGIVVGPNTPGFVANRELAEQLAEIGVILLMFGVGLHFHFQDLLAVRKVAVPGALGQIAAATVLGMVLGLAYGWGWVAGLIFGLAISVASTVVLLRVLADNNDLHTPTGHIAVGWLIVEDLFTVLVLVLLPVVFEARGGVGQIPIAVAGSIAKIGLLVAFVVLGGGRVLPWLLARVADTRSRELFTLTVLVMALGIAVGAAKLFGVSMALGAFLAGMVVGRSDFSSRAASEALPMRDAFAVIFFVSVGMLFRPVFLFESPILVAWTLAIILLGKPLVALTIVLLLRYPFRVALAVSVALSQIGEFSFILANLGRDLEILPEPATSSLVAAAIVSISLNPMLYRLIDALDSRAKKYRHAWPWPNVSPSLAAAAPPDTPPAGSGHAVVVGYGPVGRTLVRLLRENEVEPTVVELNLETVRLLREDGVRAVYGDATHLATLKEAGTSDAIVLILSSAGMRHSAEAIRMARELNPQIRVFARSNYLREIPTLRQQGADAVFAGEGEVALAMNEFILRGLGASGEQIDRERDRIRDELFGTLLASEILIPSTTPSAAASDPGDEPISQPESVDDSPPGEPASE